LVLVVEEDMILLTQTDLQLLVVLMVVIVRFLDQIFLLLLLLAVDMVILMMKTEIQVVLAEDQVVVHGEVLEEPQHQTRDMLVALLLVLTHMETLDQAEAELVELVHLPMGNGVLVEQA
jgi:hypothetical protein